MINKPISEAQDPDIRNSQAALERAAKQAREIAINSGTSLVVKRNGKTVLVGPSKNRINKILYLYGSISLENAVTPNIRRLVVAAHARSEALTVARGAQLSNSRHR